MKKIAAIALFLGALSMAEECGLNMDGRKIIFMDTTIWWRNTHLFWGSVFVLEDGYNCEKGEYEKSFVDSNTYIQRISERGTKVLIIEQNSLSDYKIGDIFREEFLRWQKCGMLNLTYEQADSIATLLVEPINSCDIDFGATRGIASIYFSEYPYAGGGTPQQFFDWAKEDCRTVSIGKSLNHGTDRILFEHGLVQVPRSLRDEDYFVFDMNGKVVQKGVAGETIRVSIVPSIFKIGNRQALLLK